jgi:peptidoglycan/xylan/chitin deacetylase (PgdA/CDA1 family)
MDCKIIWNEVLFMHDMKNRKFIRLLAGLLVLFLAAVFLPVTGVAAEPEPGPAPAVTHNDTTNRVFGMSTGMEYNLDGAGYVRFSLDSFDNISFTGAHSLLVRHAALAGRPASLVTTLAFTPNDLSAQAAPNVTINDITNRVYGMTTRMEYSLNGSPGYIHYSAGAFSAINFSGDNTLMVRYAAAGSSQASSPATLVFTANPNVAKVLFTFDDGWLDTYTNAFPIMRAAGYRATLYACRDMIVGTGPDIMRTEQVNQLYQHGWDIGNHTTSHREYDPALTPEDPPPTLDELRILYQDNTDWIIQQFGARGAFHACYPSGYYTPELISLLQELGIMTVRTTNESSQPTPVTDPANYYELPTWPLETILNPDPGDSPLEIATAAIEAAIPAGSTVVFMVHKVEPVLADLVLTTADFQAVINYIKSKQNQVQVMTISEWYNKASATPQTPAVPAVSLNDATNTVTGMAAGMEYNLDGTGYVAYDPVAFNALVLSGRHTLLVRQAEALPIPSGLPAVLLFTPDSGAAKVIFTFDDGYKSQVTNALPIFQTAGFKATAYVSRDLIDISGKMSTADLNTLYAAGWDIGNRTYNRQNITGLDYDAIRNIYDLNKSWLTLNGWLRGLDHASYPDGQYSDLLFTALQSLGVLTGRTTDEDVLDTPVTAPDGLYKLPVLTIFNDDPYYIDRAKAAIDEAVLKGSTIIFVIHEVEPGVPGPGSILSTEGLQEIVNYAKSYTSVGSLSNVTISEWYAAQP